MRPAIVYLYYGSKWGKSLGRQRLLPKALSEYATVVFLEGRPSFTLREALRQPVGEWVEPNVLVVRHAFALRYSRIGKVLGRWASALDGYALQRELRRHGIGPIVYWLSSAKPKLLQGMPLDRLVYDCIDPSLATEPGAVAAFEDEEAFVASHARLVFGTADALCERMSKFAECVKLPNACERRLDRQGVAAPEVLRHRDRPWIGCMGTLDQRVDMKLMIDVARQLPDMTFVLVGRVNGDQAEAAAELTSLPNVVATGEVPFDVCEQFNVHFDAAIIPFQTGRIGDCTNPVKLWMYLAAGHPVVARATAEMNRYRHLVYCAESSSEFASLLRKAVQEDRSDLREERRVFAARNTWDVRARDALATLCRSGLWEEDHVDCADGNLAENV